ncbi:hypothetical protein [Coprococcus comes]|uniref:hypothetical protein n=1 Tax=Coprococcus comes TaxID=410072 RepID=UPI00156F1F14|nr:hypothetical protein [Coprococcus comes]NSD31838.1 hypothetical protein [Coprococcus comes]NSF08221.1 hypothetical protein [Coprococcus comes]
MIKTDKQLKVPKWSKNEINRWADYIELRCLYMDDHLVSKDDTNLFHGNLRSRIEQLAEFLGAQTTKTMDADKRYDRIKAGDAGLDIVSFLKLDEASHIPVALAQCTCSYDEWINKQESINSDTWRTRIDPIAPFWRYMYVPFYCHNASGKFEQLTDIHTCLIDRQRILCLLDLHHELFEQLESLQLQVLINNIW